MLKNILRNSRYKKQPLSLGLRQSIQGRCPHSWTSFVGWGRGCSSLNSKEASGVPAWQNPLEIYCENLLETRLWSWESRHGAVSCERQSLQNCPGGVPEEASGSSLGLCTLQEPGAREVKCTSGSHRACRSRCWELPVGWG